MCKLSRENTGVLLVLSLKKAGGKIEKADGRWQRAEGKRKVIVVLIYRLRPRFLAARSAALVAGRWQQEAGGRRQNAAGDWEWLAVSMRFSRVPHEGLEDLGSCTHDV